MAIIKDSLGRSWDPKKHPRDRKGRFIRTFSKIYMFLDGMSKPYAVGTVDSIGDENHINATITAVPKGGNSADIGKKVFVKASQVESLNEKASLKDSKSKVDPITESFNLPQGILDKFQGDKDKYKASLREKSLELGFSEEQISDMEKLLEPQPGDSDKGAYLVGLHAYNLFSEDEFTDAEVRDFTDLLDSLGSDSDLYDDTPDAVTGLQPLIDKFNDDYNQTDVLPVVALREFVDVKTGNRVGIVGKDDFVTLKESDDGWEVTNQDSDFTPDSSTKDISSWDKIGASKGSNPGGTYRDENGAEWYVKTPETDLHAQNEVLAAQFYKEAGISSADAQLVDVGGGKIGVASPIVPESKTKKFSNLMSKLRGNSSLSDAEASDVEDLQSGFVVDAWLANWDVGGLGDDNIIFGDDDKGHRIDNGGALLFRAQGGEKGNQFGPEVGELDSLTDSSLNKTAPLFAGMSESDKKESAKKVADISEDRIDEIVDSSGMDETNGNKVKETLKARRRFIMEKFDLTEEQQSDEDFPTEEQESVDPAPTEEQPSLDEQFPNPSGLDSDELNSKTTELKDKFDNLPEGSEDYEPVSKKLVQYLTTLAMQDSEGAASLLKKTQQAEKDNKYLYTTKDDVEVDPSVLIDGYNPGNTVLLKQMVDEDGPYRWFENGKEKGTKFRAGDKVWKVFENEHKPEEGPVYIWGEVVDMPTHSQAYIVIKDVNPDNAHLYEKDENGKTAKNQFRKIKLKYVNKYYGSDDNGVPLTSPLSEEDTISAEVDESDVSSPPPSPESLPVKIEPLPYGGREFSPAIPQEPLYKSLENYEAVTGGFEDLSNKDQLVFSDGSVIHILKSPNNNDIFADVYDSDGVYVGTTPIETLKTDQDHILSMLNSSGNSPESTPPGKDLIDQTKKYDPITTGQVQLALMLNDEMLSKEQTVEIGNYRVSKNSVDGTYSLHNNEGGTLYTTPVDESIVFKAKYLADFINMTESAGNSSSNDTNQLEDSDLQKLLESGHGAIQLQSPNSSSTYSLNWSINNKLIVEDYSGNTVGKVDASEGVSKIQKTVDAFIESDVDYKSGNTSSYVSNQTLLEAIEPHIDKNNEFTSPGALNLGAGNVVTFSGDGDVYDLSLFRNGVEVKKAEVSRGLSKEEMSFILGSFVNKISAPNHNEDGEIVPDPEEDIVPDAPVYMDSKGTGLSVGDTVFDGKGGQGVIVKFNPKGVTIDYGDGKKGARMFKYVTKVGYDNPTPTSKPDQSSEWFEKPEPALPTPVSQSGVIDGKFVNDAWMKEAENNWKANKTGSNDNFSESGTYHWYAEVQGGSSSSLEHLKDKGFITDSMYDDAKMQQQGAKDLIDHALAKYQLDYKQWSDDHSAWAKANGIDLGDPSNFTPKGMSESVSDFTDPNNASLGQTWASGVWAGSKLKLTTEQLNSVKSYTGGGYEGINKLGYDPVNASSQYQKDFDNVGEALTLATRVPEDIVVIRAVSLDTLFDPTTGSPFNSSSVSEIQKLTGNIIYNGGYTSSSPGPVPGFGAYKPVWLRIRVPKGSKGLYVSDPHNVISSVGYAENELILDSGQHFYVHGVSQETTSEGEKTIVEVEIVPEGWTPPGGYIVGAGAAAPEGATAVPGL